MAKRPPAPSHFDDLSRTDRCPPPIACSRKHSADSGGFSTQRSRERMRVWGCVILSSTLKKYVFGNNFPILASKILSVGSSFFCWGIFPVLLGVQSSGGENFPTFPSGGYAHVRLQKYGVLDLLSRGRKNCQLDSQRW